MRELPVKKTNAEIPDVQNTKDGFPKKYIAKVGTRDATLPVKVLRKDGTLNEGTGVFSMYSDLNEETKGTNMSRYRILIEETLASDNYKLNEVVPHLLHQCKERLKSDNAYVKVKFDYFLKRIAPVSLHVSHMDYKAEIEGRLVDGKTSLYLTVHVMYASLCPCSKEISGYDPVTQTGKGAHNQRSIGSLTVELNPDATEWIWIEDLIDIIENNASAPIINVLKRVDEAYQTELMYKNPRFVEDMVRLIGDDLDKELDKKILDYVIVVNHQESIHTAQAVAVMSAGRGMH